MYHKPAPTKTVFNVGFFVSSMACLDRLNKVISKAFFKGRKDKKEFAGN